MYRGSKRLHNYRINYVGWLSSKEATRHLLLIEWNTGKFKDQEGAKSAPQSPTKWDCKENCILPRTPIVSWGSWSRTTQVDAMAKPLACG